MFRFIAENQKSHFNIFWYCKEEPY